MAAGSGVFRPYTFVDVLGTINQQSTQSSSTTQIDGVGFVGESDETMTGADSATDLLQTAAMSVWDTALWGSVAWS
jgi:hypothetical protein